MDGYESLALFDKVEQGFLLFRFDAFDIGIDHETIVFREGLVVEVGRLVGIGQFDAALSEDGLELLESIGGPMVPVIAEEQDFDGGWHWVGMCRCVKQGSKAERGQDADGGENARHELPPTKATLIDGDTLRLATARRELK